MKRIKSFGVFQTAKVVAIIYFLISAVILIPAVLIGMAFMGNNNIFPFAGAFVIFLPVIYGIIGFITTAIGCVIYNVIAGWTGGIEFEVTTDEPPMPFNPETRFEKVVE